MNLEDCLAKRGYIDYKDITLCDLSKFRSGRTNCERKFQVHSKGFCEVYHCKELAINKFLELKRKNYGA